MSVETRAPLSDVAVSESQTPTALIGPLTGTRPGYEALKRVMDVCVAAFLLVALAPLLLLAAIAIKLSSRGPVFFRHERVGSDGTSFDVLKFRSMSAGTRHIDERLRTAFSENYKLDNDPRVTRVGRFIRKTSIDELPQLLHVLSGKMSLVGPRPVTTAELREKYGESASLILSVKPGLTGLWQVSGRSTLPYDERVRLDVEYVQTRSFRMDFWLLCRTVPTVLRMRGSV